MKLKVGSHRQTDLRERIAAMKPARSLPLIHITTVGTALHILDDGLLEARTCPVMGRKLVYFFSGRAAYRYHGDDIQSERIGRFPVAFIANPDRVKTSHVYPFDTGAAFTDKFRDDAEPGLGNTFGNLGKVGGALVRGATSSAISQGIGVVTGLQEKFSWVSVAAAGIGAAAGAGAKAEFGLGDGFGSQLAVSSASALANAATRSVLNGSNFGNNVIASIPDVVGQALGNYLAKEVGSAFENRLSLKQDSSGNPSSTSQPYSNTIPKPVSRNLITGRTVNTGGYDRYFIDGTDVVVATGMRSNGVITDGFIQNVLNARIGNQQATHYSKINSSLSQGFNLAADRYVLNSKLAHQQHQVLQSLKHTNSIDVIEFMARTSLEYATRIALANAKREAYKQSIINERQRRLDELHANIRRSHNRLGAAVLIGGAAIAGGSIEVAAAGAGTLTLGSAATFFSTAGRGVSLATKIGAIAGGSFEGISQVIEGSFDPLQLASKTLQGAAVGFTASYTGGLSVWGRSLGTFVPQVFIAGGTGATYGGIEETGSELINSVVTGADISFSNIFDRAKLDFLTFGAGGATGAIAGKYLQSLPILGGRNNLSNRGIAIVASAGEIVGGALGFFAPTPQDDLTATGALPIED